MSELATELRLTLLKGPEGRSVKIGGRQEILENIFLKLKYPGSLASTQWTAAS